ncbi:hypothetical protein J6590_103940 [Homalodisca vitripennis]|nr:hypothetical protein J6590_103940 [Homalodisca vitripennis]
MTVGFLRPIDRLCSNPIPYKGQYDRQLLRQQPKGACDSYGETNHRQQIGLQLDPPSACDVISLRFDLSQLIMAITPRGQKSHLGPPPAEIHDENVMALISNHVHSEEGEARLYQSLQSTQAGGSTPLCLGWQEPLTLMEQTHPLQQSSPAVD